jgi:hypothetical protein
MKTLIAASLLLALASPAFANSYDTWDCGHDIDVAYGHYVQFSSARNPPSKGSIKVAWDYQGKEPTLRLNGKACHLMSPKELAKKACAKGSKEMCKEVEENWPTKREKHGTPSQ